VAIGRAVTATPLEANLSIGDYTAKWQTAEETRAEPGKKQSVYTRLRSCDMILLGKGIWDLKSLRGN
jgi:hypothetical protein